MEHASLGLGWRSFNHFVITINVNKVRNIPRTVAGVTDSDITLVIQSAKSRGITTATNATCNWVTRRSCRRGLSKGSALSKKIFYL